MAMVIKMSTIKINGYLIHQKNFNVYDEILTYLTEDGYIKTLYALGVKKINSKNSRSIKYGNLVEIEFFNTTNINKISKLKKIVNITEFDLKKSQSLALLLMNGIVFIQKYIDKNVYLIYQEILVLINRNYNEYFISIIAIIKLINYFYKYLSQFKTINYYFYNNLINKNSLKLNNSEFDFLNNIINENITVANLYKYFSTTIDIEKLFSKIYIYWKDLIYKKGV